jgi:hypothetical protein
MSLVAIATSCGDSADALSGTSWRLNSLFVDGQPFLIDQPLFMDIDEHGFHAATTCNGASGRFGGEIIVTLMACLDERATSGERYMLQAYQDDPRRHDGQLIFEAGDVRLVYDSYRDPAATDLFAVLGDVSASVDESHLPSAQVTGTVPPNFDVLIPLPSPSSDIDLFLASFKGSICVVYGTSTAMDKWCDALRMAEHRALAVNLPIYGVGLVRIAVIPDQFADAAVVRKDLGTYQTNVLIVRDDAPEGWHDLRNNEGEVLRVLIPAG